MSLQSKMKKGNLLRFICLFRGHKMKKGSVRFDIMGIRAMTVGMICQRCKKLEPLGEASSNKATSGMAKEGAK